MDYYNNPSKRNEYRNELKNKTNENTYNKIIYLLEKFNFKPFPMLCIFGLGVLTGAALGIKGIKLCLEKFRSQTVYFVIGMLLASLYSIMMGPVTLDDPKPWKSIGRINWIFFVIGALIIVGLQTFKMVKVKKAKNINE